MECQLPGLDIKLTWIETVKGFDSYQLTDLNKKKNSLNRARFLGTTTLLFALALLEFHILVMFSISKFRYIVKMSALSDI